MRHRYLNWLVALTLIVGAIVPGTMAPSSVKARSRATETSWAMAPSREAVDPPPATEDVPTDAIQSPQRSPNPAPSSKSASHSSSMLRLRAGAFDPLRNPPRIPSHLLRAQTPATPTLHLVQFNGPIQDQWREQMDNLGLEVVTYIPDYAYLVWGRSAAVSALQTRTRTRWSGAYHAFYALHPRLARLEDNQEPINVMIQVYSHTHAEAVIARILKRAEIILRAPYPSLSYWNLGIQIQAQALSWLSALPGVVNVEPYPEYRPFDEIQGQIMAGQLNAAGTLPTGPGYLHWLTNTVGFSTNPDDYPIVDVTDDGIDDGDESPRHADFYEFGDFARADRLIYNRNWTGDVSADSAGGHGNLNAAIVGGYNSQTGTLYQDIDGYSYGLGINPFGRIGGSKVFNNDGNWGHAGSDAEVVSASYESGARISTNSWGCGPPWCDGAPYTVDAQTYDALVRDAVANRAGNQEMIILFAAGNDGTTNTTIGTPATAKNVIAVGASENVRPTWTDGCGDGPTQADNAQDIADFSSRGPTSDGRTKPDLVAPGTHIQGAASQSPNYKGTGVCDIYYPPFQTLYAASSGTSHATPAVAGAASLIYHYYVAKGIGQETSPNKGSSSEGSPPSPAMMKAYLINTTRYLTGTGTNNMLPSNIQGYGLVNLGTAFDGAAQLAVDQTVVFTQTGEVYDLYGQINNPNKPLRITLAWSDAPGSTIGDAFVNNLDLEVILNGEIYMGNHFSGTVSLPGGSADPRNNVESVYVPATGTISETFLVRVKATNIAGDGLPNNADLTDQDFALIVYNAKAPSLATMQGMVYNDGTSVDMQRALAQARNPIAGAHIQAVGDTTRDTISTWSAADGTYKLSLMGDTYTLTTTAYGYYTHTQTGVTIRPGELMTHHIPLTPLPTTVVSGTVRDGSGQNWPLYAQIDIAPPWDGVPSHGGVYFTHPVSGAYAVTLPIGIPFTFTVHAVGGGYQPVTRVITPTSPTLQSNNTEHFTLTVDPATCNGQEGYQAGYTETCTPIKGGGIIVGNAYNANTGTGVNNAFITSLDYPTDTTTTWATPDDPAVDDGFYILFSSLTGTHRLEARAPYMLTDTQLITIPLPQQEISVKDFALRAPTIDVVSEGLDVVLTPGYTKARDLTIFNQGSADLHWELKETRPHLYENGPMVNDPGTGEQGTDKTHPLDRFDESILQDLSLGMISIGFNHAEAARYRVADDFTIPSTGGNSNGWTIDTITFFAYQTGSPVWHTGIAASTITSVTLRIWNGPPGDSDSYPIFGDTFTNRLVHTTWSGIYRTREASTNTDRPIMANTVNVGTTLMPGTYWLDWQSDGTLDSGPWAPPITINGQITTGNALSFNGTAWPPAQDSGTNTQQGFPFIINGHADLIPWLTAAPISSTVVAPDVSVAVADASKDRRPSANGGENTEQVTLTFDATGMSPGVYTSTLFVLHDAPDAMEMKPYIELPLTLTVQSHGLLLKPTTATKVSMPGDSVTYTLRLTNTGITTDSFQLSADPGWPTHFTATSMLTDTAPAEVGVPTEVGAPAVVGIGPLAPHTGTDIQVIVDIPADALGGAHDAITLTATSQQGGPAINTSSRLTTTVARIIAIDPQPRELHAILNPDTNAYTTLEVKSLGTLTATWATTETPAASWLHVHPHDGTTAPGDTTSVKLKLQADGMTSGTYTTTLLISLDHTEGYTKHDILNNTTITPQTKVTVTLSVITGCIPVQAMTISTDPSTPRAGESITFTGEVQAALLTDRESRTITYTWDFGDTTPLTQGPTVHHIYPIAGVYTATLIGRNTCSTARAHKRITVVGEPDLSVSPRALAITLTAGLTTSRGLTLTNLGTAPLSWHLVATSTVHWLSAGPTSSTLAPQDHEKLWITFTAPSYVRSYTSTLVIQSDVPTIPQVRIPITLNVIPPPCQAVSIGALKSDSPVTVGETLHVTATVSGDEPITPTWDVRGMSGGAHLTTLTPVLTYNEAGTYTVKLNVVNGCPTSDTRAITVMVEPKPPPCAPVSIENLESDSPTLLGERTYFTATVSGNTPITYTWDFNNDGFSEQHGTTLSRTTYLYPLASTYIAPRAYTATLHVSNRCPSSATQTLRVELTSPTTACAPVAGASFTTTPSIPKRGEPVRFNGYVNQGDAPITWIWAFGDGTIKRLEAIEGGETVSHTYALEGTYTVVMTTTNCAGGSTAVATRTLTVASTRHYSHFPLILRNYGG